MFMRMDCQNVSYMLISFHSDDTNRGWCSIKQELKQTIVCLFNDTKSQYLEYIW